MKPTHGDPLVPEDHGEIKSEELLALEKQVDGLKAAWGLEPSSAKQWESSSNAMVSMKAKRSSG